MSDHDPTDDELESEHSHPMMANRARHAPKLGEEPRAISLADVRAEMELPSETRREALLEETYSPVAPRKSPMPPRPPPQAKRSPLASLAAVVPLHPTGAPSMHDYRDSDSRLVESDAWSQFAAAALPLCAGAEDPEGAAALVADRLLEERRKRFG